MQREFSDVAPTPTGRWHDSCTDLTAVTKAVAIQALGALMLAACADAADTPSRSAEQPELTMAARSYAGRCIDALDEIPAMPCNGPNSYAVPMWTYDDRGARRTLMRDELADREAVRQLCDSSFTGLETHHFACTEGSRVVRVETPAATWHGLCVTANADGSVPADRVPQRYYLANIVGRNPRGDSCFFHGRPQLHDDCAEPWFGLEGALSGLRHVDLERAPSADEIAFWQSFDFEADHMPSSCVGCHRSDATLVPPSMGGVMTPLGTRVIPSIPGSYRDYNPIEEVGPDDPSYEPPLQPKATQTAPCRSCHGLQASRFFCETALHQAFDTDYDWPGAGWHKRLLERRLRRNGSSFEASAYEAALQHLQTCCTTSSRQDYTRLADLGCW